MDQNITKTVTKQSNKEHIAMEEELAPGFRFFPTEEELVSFYLHNKLEGKRPELERVIPAVDIHNLEPWNLPKLSGELCRGDTEQWFFFAPRQERETRGGRPNRTTASGYWKATGSPGYVYSKDNRVIGVKKTMVFYKGKAPTGRKTKWKMNEYKAIEESAASPSSTPIPKLRNEYSLCRVYVISGCVRAFDRRPSEFLTEERDKKQGHVDTQILGKSSTPESSNSGGDVRVDHVEIEGSSSSDIEPLWAWEQMDWL